MATQAKPQQKQGGAKSSSGSTRNNSNNSNRSGSSNNSNRGNNTKNSNSSNNNNNRNNSNNRNRSNSNNSNHNSSNNRSGGNNRRSRNRRGGSGGGQGGYRNDNQPSKPEQPSPSSDAAVEAEVKKAAPTEVIVGDYITVRDLAKLIERSPIDLIKVLMQYGVMAPITHNIDHDTAVILGDELGVKVRREKLAEPEQTLESRVARDEALAEEVEEEPATGQNHIQQILDRETEERLTLRPAVVAVLGHVDHGKTTLLDQIRKTDVVSGEAGGITQRTGAYQVDVRGEKITFLDTPGHEAFTAMRSRGAQVTDIVVLVVAADDGIMPQTKEAISHAQAADVTIIVAMNKIDRPNANPTKVMEELSSAGLQPEEWGGDTIVVPVSALHGTGIEDLLDNILVVAELAEYKANPKGTFAGTVIEGTLDRHRGATTTMLVQNGTVKVGDSLVVGTTWGRVRAMFDHDGQALTQADPSCPVVFLGLQDVPTAGDIVSRVKNDKDARRISEERTLDAKALAEQPMTQQRMSFDDIFARLAEGETKTLNLIVRADMQGTLEPVVQSLNELGHEEVKIKILQSAIGNISESDIMLAEASDAVVIGFSVHTDRAALSRAEASGIEIRHYDIIYKMLEDVQDAVTGMLEPIYEDRTIGKAKVLQLFKLRRGMIIGCNVAEGIIKRGAKARVWRNSDEIVPATSVDTLRRFTEDVPEVRTGFECGLRLADSSAPLKEGDIIEVYEKYRIR